MLQCPNKCAACSGDQRECTCADQPPAKKKRASQKPSSSQPAAAAKADPKKLYDRLVKEHERVGVAFRNQQKQNEELAAELEEKTKELEEANNDAEELANLVRTKEEAIKTLQQRLADAKRMIAELKAEVQTLRQSRSEGPQGQQEQQQQQQRDSRVSAHSLETIHQRYAKVLQTLTENSCSMANAFRLSGCPRSTLRDFVAIAELRIVDAREHDLVIRDLEGGSVKELEAACRKRLRRFLPVLSNLRREGRLLPLKFDHRFYE